MSDPDSSGSRPVFRPSGYADRTPCLGGGSVSRESRTASGKAGLSGAEAGRQGLPSHRSQMAFPSTGQLEKFLTVMWERPGSAEAVRSLQRVSTWTFPAMVACPREASGPRVAHWPLLGARLNTASFQGREWHSAPVLGSWDLCVK